MNKPNIIDLRIILLGDSDVGKKSIVQRFKVLKSTETKEISLKEFIRRKNLLNRKKVVKLAKKNNELSEEEKRDKMKEDKRIDLMRFTKIFRMELNSIHISFCPCPDAEPLDYDYNPIEDDDENNEFEREYKISIKNIIRSIEEIIIKPPDDQRAQIEILFLLCFDLSNFTSFENLIIFFTQINKHFHLTENTFKLVLIGTKLDKKKPMGGEEKENLENFKNQLKLPYYEVSSLMVFNFENFFEKLILDIFSKDFPFLSNEYYKNIFHKILNTKKDFTKTKREDFVMNSENPGSNKYNNDIYAYPHNKKDFLKIFKDKTKFNKKIFINKTGIMFPPIKDIKEEINSTETNKKNSKEFKEEFLAVNWDTIKNDKIQAALELNSNIPGYSFGIKTNKSLGLKQERDNLRNLKEKEIMNKLEGYIFSGSQVLPLRSYRSTLNLEQYQEQYEQNRIDKRNKQLEKRKEIFDMIKERHNEIQLKNSRSFNRKIYKIKEKEKKYEKIRKYLENQKKMKKFNTIDLDEKRTSYKYFEPKKKFYDPISSISTKKGFTFGQKLEIKYEQKDSPDFPIFMDDFEKLIEKNKKRGEIKSFGNRFPVYKTEENGDSSYVMEKQKDFEKKRRRFRTQLFSDFFDNRKDKREEVINNKKLIFEIQEKKLKDQIKKSYKTDENYLIRDINYNQIESSSPKYTIKGKYKNTLFSQNNKDDENSNNKRFATISGKEIDYEKDFIRPNIRAIYPRYPAFSFGSSKRFDLLEKSKKKDKKEKNKRYDDDSDIFKGYRDTQSFLMAQTSMGTDEKLKLEDNGNPGPGMYKIKGFADDVTLRGTKINLTRIKLREKEKDEEIDKERRAKLREEWFKERKSQLKMGIKDYYNSKIKSNNENNEKELINNN